MRWLVGVFGLLLAGCGTQTVTTTVRLTETHATTVVKRIAPTPLVLVPDVSGGLVYKPDVIGLGATTAIERIRWTGYGNAVAVGRGRFPLNDCDPNCAEGKIKWVPATVRLKVRALCQGQLAYRLMAISAPGTSFDGQFDAVSAVIGATREAC